MNKTHSMIFAGFGGQGVLFAGKLVAYAGLCDDKEVSWLPSYGPEMRGGTANCSVTLSDEPIGTPIITVPNVVVAMNRPSLDKFENAIEEGGIVIIDSTLIDRKIDREDISAFYVPATKLAEESGLKTLANMILVGKLLKETGFSTMETLKKALEKCVPPKKHHLLDANIKAIELGYNY